MAKVVCFDIDGVLTEEDKTDHNNLAGSYIARSPRPRAKELMQRAYESGWYVCLFTGRRTAQRRMTEDWLFSHGFHYHALFMDKPYYTVFLEDRVAGVTVEEQFDAFEGMLNDKAIPADFYFRRSDEEIFRNLGTTVMPDSSEYEDEEGSDDDDLTLSVEPRADVVAEVKALQKALKNSVDVRTQDLSDHREWLINMVLDCLNHSYISDEDKHNFKMSLIEKICSDGMGNYDFGDDFDNDAKSSVKSYTGKVLDDFHVFMNKNNEDYSSSMFASKRNADALIEIAATMRRARSNVMSIIKREPWKENEL